jgi:hypothetical protein
MKAEAQCPACKAALPILIGRKETSRTATCTCGKKWDYSAWVIKRTENKTFSKIEMFPHME